MSDENIYNVLPLSSKGGNIVPSEIIKCHWKYCKGLNIKNTSKYRGTIHNGWWHLPDPFIILHCRVVQNFKELQCKMIPFFKNMKLLQYILLESLTVLLHIINEITASFTFLYSTAVSFQSFPKTLFLNKLYTTHHLNHFAAKKKNPLAGICQRVNYM